jgi:hypothetical protein
MPVRITAAVLAFIGASLVQADCPELNRLPADLSNGQISLSGGAAPTGARAADDFLTPLGNGNAYDVRTIKAIMIANYPMSSGNVGFTIYTDTTVGTNPARPHPGTGMASPNALTTTVRDLGPWSATAPDGRSFRIYEVTWAMPAGTMQLAPGQRYWLSPFGIGAAAGATVDYAYAALGAPGASVGEPVNASTGSPGTGAFTTWSNTASGCCLGGTHDLGIFVDLQQVGRPRADLTCDGLLSLADVFEFMNLWFAGSPSGDFNGVNGQTIQDIFDFLAAWFAGV